MSGSFGSAQWMYDKGLYEYHIDQSLRFNDDDSAYLSRTPASAGNRKTWTWSGWVKRGNFVYQELFSGYTDNNNQLINRLNPTTISIFQDIGGSRVFELETNAVYRDTSAWYHIVIAFDTTEAVSSNRIKLYVNGEQVTSFSTSNYPSLNTDYEINSTTGHFIGQRGNGSSLFDGYLAEVNFIDGQALDPTSFGEFKSGVWIPKSYSGSYGTNGFYLDFGNSGSLGADSSGNGNNWTPNNLAATDQVPDSPTNNFATLNPLEAGNGNYAEGNLKFSASTASVHQMASSAVSISSGKWYAEILVSAVGGTYPHIGITPANTSNATYVGNNGYAYRSDGQKQLLNATAESYGASYTSGDIIGVALDADSGIITFYKNGSSQGVASSSVDTGTSWRISNSLYSTGGISLANFGQDSSFAGNKTAQGNTDANGIGDFYYAPPAGYLALCTANLPDPAIDPAQDDVPEDYFNTVLYTGTGAAQSITGVGFQPDWVWLKSRSDAYGHQLFDAVRGTTKFLSSNVTNAEATNATTLTSFDSDGFSIGNNPGINTASDNHVSWNWLAGNGTSSNTDGTITSTVSANQKAGFSVVTFTTDGTNTNVGTGLSSSAPLDMVVIKRRDSTSEWQVGHRFSGQGLNFAYHLELNSTAALSGSGPYFMGTQATSNGDRIYLASGTYGVSSATWVAYCFQSVEGFSKFGSYTGNGSASDGPFVYTGFRPAFVLMKDTGSTEQWQMVDSARDTYNVVDSCLFPNSSGAEATASSIHRDFLSNGFKVRTSDTSQNASGRTYIYMAFAEMPFKYSLGR